jgi:hypothetical protein
MGNRGDHVKLELGGSCSETVLSGGRCAVLKSVALQIQEAGPSESSAGPSEQIAGSAPSEDPLGNMGTDFGNCNLVECKVLTSNRAYRRGMMQSRSVLSTFQNS